jgi:hypothetical protein
VVERLGAAAVLADVVGGPPDAEVLALHGEFTDEVGEVAVVGIAAGFGPKIADACIRDTLPVRVEPAGLAIEEDEPGQVRRTVRVREDLGVQRVAEPVGGEDVEAAVADAADSVMESRTRCTPGRTRSGVRRAVAGCRLAARTRSKRWVRSTSSS